MHASVFSCTASRRWLSLTALMGLALLPQPPARADYYSSNTSDGYASLDSGFGGGSTTVRAGGTLTMTAGMGTYGGTSIDYGTGIQCDQVVSGPWWLVNYQAGLQGNFGPDSAILRYIYRATDNPSNWWEGRVYFHVTFYPSYAEANLGFFRVLVRGSWPTFSSLPSSIAQGDTFTATTLGQDDDGMLSSVTTQVSTNGGAWATLGSAGGGNGWSSTTPGTPITAGAAGTTYQFRAWTTDTNGYQSRVITSAVYTTTAPPPPTGYTTPAGDIGTLFKPLNGAPKAAPTGLTCVISGVTYDLSDLFLPRVNSPRPNVGYTAANGQDLSLIFESK
ncbi:MAG: hypothetical protein ACOZE5_18140 [Verrucomicrobiota bacterium]